jgi:hypothetical protein
VTQLGACWYQSQFNEFDLYFKQLGLDGGFTDEPSTLAAYLDAQVGRGFRTCCREVGILCASLQTAP